ncbi:MAG: hypothetical protein H6739_07865 [Alphaproteobacteria bacterium]|nr:hypothetical protein [Alphaproteobacteria bacterium]
MNIVPSTALGAKQRMAASGLILGGWVALHMAGNLLFFGPPALINAYGGALQGSPLVWGMRAGLLVLITVHVDAAVRVIRQTRRARGGGYRGPRALGQTSLAARSMAWTGALLVGLLVYHLLHIFGPLHPDYLSGDVHHNLSAGLASPIHALAYGVMAGLTGLHLRHGAVSMLRTLGLVWPRVERGLVVAAVTVAVGFCLPALASLVG